MLTKEMLNEYARKTGSPVRRWIAGVLEDAFDDYDDWKKLVKDYTNDAVKNGITPLVYHSDFEDFYETNKIEISIALGFFMEEIGERDLKAIFRDWDVSDPLATQSWNKFLIVAFMFDYGLEFVLAELGIDLLA